jgi:hypothetical protein
VGKKQKRWVYSPPKPATPNVSEDLKTEVTTKANELIETILKPHYIQPPPENPQFNYIIDLYGKWYHSSFYFCAKYCVPGPNAIVPDFEAKFARMQYAGGNRFHLSFMRYTGQWVQLSSDLTIDECLVAIRDEPYFAF